MNLEETTLRKYFWLILNVVLAALALLIILFGIPAIQRYNDSVYPARMVSVSAEGKTTASPDLAESSFSVVSQGKNPEELTEANNQKMATVVNFLKAKGVETKDIKTTAYNLAPDYRYDENSGRNFISGYTLTQTISVKMRDLAKAPEIVGGLTPLGVNQIGGINFVVEDMDAALNDARAEAIAKARAKAEAMAKAAGVRLGRLVNLSESSGPGPYPYFEKAYGAGDMIAPSVAPLEPGESEVTVTVSLTYALR